MPLILYIKNIYLVYWRLVKQIVRKSYSGGKGHWFRPLLLMVDICITRPELRIPAMHLLVNTFPAFNEANTVFHPSKTIYELLIRTSFIVFAWLMIAKYWVRAIIEAIGLFLSSYISKLRYLWVCEIWGQFNEIDMLSIPTWLNRSLNLKIFLHMCDR